MKETADIAIGPAAGAGNQMYRWLGSFWTALCRDSRLAQQLQQAEGLLSAQLLLDCEETRLLSDHREAPVFHRERWYPVRLLESERNTGPAAAVRAGHAYAPVVGPQTGSPFRLGQMLTVGGPMAVGGVSIYPMPAGAPVSSLGVITDSVDRPSRVLVRDADFTIENGALVFTAASDPFALGFAAEEAAAADGSPTRSVTLWMSDALFDRDWVHKYVGHALGIRTPSTRFHARFLTAIWDLYAAGASSAAFRSAIAAVFDEPFALDEGEVVEGVYTADGQDTRIVTDRNVYLVPPSSVLRPRIAPGAALTKGELLTDTVRVYENLDPARLGADGNDADRLRADTAALFLPAGLFRARLRHGIGITWQLQPITLAGTDANGNPKLRFTVYGSPEDVEAYWADFWAYCEKQGVSGAACFDGLLRDTLPTVEGAVCGEVSPVEYFLANFLKANAVIVAVDSDRLSAAGRGAMHMVATCRSALPAHVLMLVVENATLPVEEYDAGACADSLEAMLAVPLADEAGGGVRSAKGMVYRDRLSASWLPVCNGELE